MQLDHFEFLATFLPSERRVLTRTGVELHRRQYWSDALAPWVGQKKQVSVHIDIRDITFVYVRTPGGVLVKCAVTNPRTPAISLAEWQAVLAADRRLSRDPSMLAIRVESASRTEMLVSEAKRSRKIKRRNATKAAGDFHRATSSPSLPKSEMPDERSAAVISNDIKPNKIYGDYANE